MESRALLLTLIKHSTEESDEDTIQSVVLGIFNEQSLFIDAQRKAYKSLMNQGFKAVGDGVFMSDNFPNYSAFIRHHEPMEPSISGEIVNIWMQSLERTVIQA